MTPIKLPSLGYFKNGNGWLGSSGLLRFQIEPFDKETMTMTVVLWQGPFSRPYAQEIGRESFTLSEEGLNSLLGFLSVRAGELEREPAFTAQETNAYYREIKAREQAAQSE